MVLGAAGQVISEVGGGRQNVKVQNPNDKGERLRLRLRLRVGSKE